MMQSLALQKSSQVNRAGNCRRCGGLFGYQPAAYFRRTKLKSSPILIDQQGGSQE